MFEWLFKYSPAHFQRGDLLLASGWPTWLLLVLIGVVAAALYLDSRRRRGALTGGRLVAVWGLQATFAAVVLVLLWQPALGLRALRAQENVVAVLMDTSGSMAYGQEGQSRLQQAVVGLEGDALPALAENFGVRLYAMSEGATPIDSLDEVPPPGTTTRLGDALIEVLREARTTTLGAVVLVSDGADNSRGATQQQLAEIAGFGVPIHTVGVGREVVPDDLELSEVMIAPRALPGATVSAQMGIRHAGPGTARVKVYDGDTILASREVSLAEAAGMTTHWVDFDAGEAGLKELRFTVEPLDSERNTINNTQRRVMDVPSETRRVLYLEGEPRWEYKFIRRAAALDPTLELVSLLRTTPNKYYRQGVASPEELRDGLPAERSELFSFDALIVGSFEAAALSAEQQETIRDFVSERGGSLLMLGGRRGLGDGGWGNSGVAEVLPARLPEEAGNTFVRAQVRVALTVEGAEAAITRLDPDPDTNLELWRGMPALADFQSLGGLKPAAVALLEASYDNSSQPLLVTQRYGRGESYILATGGTWRWRMHLPHEDTRHEAFWRQLLRALAAQAPPRVVISTDSLLYADETEITVRAEVRNDTYEPVSDATVTVAVMPEAGARTSLKLQPAAGEEGTYEGTFTAEGTGIYRLDATAVTDEERLGTASLHLRREDGIAEHFGLQQNRALLERLAALGGGRYWTLDEIAGLPEAISFSDAGVSERRLLDLWDMPIIFLLLFALKAAEWLVRRKWGTL